MPKIVDKEQKRKDIAISCSDLIHDVGMKKLTIAQVAKTAGIGKGTVYEYFENKEDIIFEIINIHIEQYHNEFLESMKNINSTKEKVFHFFNFVLDDSEKNIKNFNGYKEYLSIILSNDYPEMNHFNKNCDIFLDMQLKKVIQEGIDKKQLLPQALNFCDSIRIFEKGIAIKKMTENEFEAKEEVQKFVNNIFEFIEVKK